MSKKIRHVLGISGGKDSAALAIYMHKRHPEIDLELYTCDTGKELEATYQTIKNIESYTGKKIKLLQAGEGSDEDPFDHFLKEYGDFLPSSAARWCTSKLKVKPFEEFVGQGLIISYVGIRGDEDREGYISKNPNVQSIFPFRRNIWSQDVIDKLLHNKNLSKLLEIAKSYDFGKKNIPIQELINEPLSKNLNQTKKLNRLLDLDVKGFNRIVFDFLKTTEYPIAFEDNFPLIANEDNLVRADIFKLLEDSGVGVPAYYKPIEFEVDGKKGTYSRSRSGCYFCFFQQKIEWVWLYEQHPTLYKKAMEYEKEGYTWAQDESLEELIQPERIKKIKLDYIKRSERKANKIKTYGTGLLYDNPDIIDAEDEGCAACFI